MIVSGERLNAVGLNSVVFCVVEVMRSDIVLVCGGRGVASNHCTTVRRESVR